MEPKFHDDKMIARYLLGELPEAEQTKLEEQAFSDSDYLQQVRAVEKDLMDEYARGELSGAEREAFEQRFFASESRRRQIEFARALLQGRGESPARASAAAATTSWWDSLFLFGRGLNPALRFALAALALFVVIGGVWLFRESARSRREQAQIQPPSEATPPVQENATSKSNAERRAQNEPQVTPSPANRLEGRQTPPPVIASLLLLPGTSRGSEGHPHLTIAPATSTAQLRVVLESGDEYKTYGLQLRTIAGKVVRSQTGLPAHAGPGGRAVMLTLPASLLTTGDYELTLNGINEQQQAEPLGFYYFSVRKE